MALFSAEAYQSQSILKAKYGKNLYAFFSGESKGRFRVKIADTQAFILRYESIRGNRIIVAFRGTESVLRVPADWLTNLDKTPATSDWLPVAEEGQSQVHRGFLRAYEVIQPELIASVKDIDPRRAYITGHSLGGALATLAALDIQMQFPRIHVTMYNFGSPCIGNPVFSGTYDHLVPNSHRVVHDGDRSPEQPSEGFRHVGRLHTLKRHPDSKYPHHRCEYYLDQIEEEIGKPIPETRFFHITQPPSNAQSQNAGTKST